MTQVMSEHEPQLPAGVPDDGGPGAPARVSGRQLRELLADDMWLDELVCV